MTKQNKATLITVRMAEEQLSQLDAMLNRGETRSAFVRSLIDKAWAEHQASQR